jgi:hypothetical protein
LTSRERGFGAAGSGRELGRLLGCPGPRHKLVDAGRGPEIDELGEYVCEVGLRVDAGELAGFNKRSDAGPVLRAEIVAGKQSVLAIDRNLEVILPISGRMSSFTIAGIRCAGGARVAFRSSDARAVSSCTLR